jgi:hypothetical protein
MPGIIDNETENNGIVLLLWSSSVTLWFQTLVSGSRMAVVRNIRENCKTAQIACL